MPQKRFTGGIALMVLSATGCGLVPASPDGIMVPADPTMIGFVDPATVGGLVATTLPDGEDTSRYVHISYPRFEDAPRLNEALQAEAERQLRAFRAATRATHRNEKGAATPHGPDATNPRGANATDPHGPDTTNPRGANATDPHGPDTAPPHGSDATDPHESGAATPGAPGHGRPGVLGSGSSPETATDAAALRRPELNVDWQLVAASTDVVGVRLRTGRYLGADWGRSGRILWYDRARSAVTGSAGLLAGQSALYKVAQLVRDRLRGRVGVDPGEVSADPGEFDSMAFNRNGDLVVEFDDCQIGSCALGRVGVAVPAEQVEALLSETGRRAQRSARAASRTAPTGPGTRPGAPGPVTGAPRAAAARERALDCHQAKCVALTFDDGPGPDTPRLLDMLRRADARATFFTVGANAAAAPSVLRRMSAEGHVIGNHSWAHRNLSRLSTSRIADSLGRTQDVISSIVGSAPTLARAPYGAVSPDVAKITRGLGLTLVGWDVDAQIAPADAAAGTGNAGGRYADAKMDPNVTTARRGHTKAPSKTDAEAVRSEVARRAVEDARPGAIILLHDTGAAAVDAVPAIIEGLRAKGYVFATVPELHGAGAPEAGEAQVGAQETVEGATRRPVKAPDPAAAG